MIRRLLARRRADPTPVAEIPAHASGLRWIMAQAGGPSYVAFESLEEAQRDPDGCVVLEGDWGGQIYVTAPVRFVKCEAEALERLLSDLDAIAWPGNDGGASILFERHPSGSAIAGGMGGGVIGDEIWVHPEFVELHLDEAVREVIRGRRERLHLPGETAHP